MISEHHVFNRTSQWRDAMHVESSDGKGPAFTSSLKARYLDVP